MDFIPAWQQTSNLSRSYFTSCTSLKHRNKHVPQCDSPDALLITARSCQRDAGIHSAREALLWQLIAKNRKRRLALHTALRKVYQRRQLLLRVACLTVLLLANNKGAEVLSRSCRRLQRNFGWFTNVWSTYSEKRFKKTFRISR